MDSRYLVEDSGLPRLPLVAEGRLDPTTQERVFGRAI
jgi:hypothetical protein